MNAEPSTSRSIRPLLYQVIAWVCWSISLLVSAGLYVMAETIKRDVYFHRYYGHHPMTSLTVVMIIFPAWIAILPLLWLPFVIAYQRRSQPKGIVLLPLVMTMFITAIVIFVLILFSGPPIQM